MSPLSELERIVKLETTQNSHADMLVVFSKSLDNLSKSFNQVKYTLFGGVSFFIIQQIGLLKFIKGIL